MGAGAAKLVEGGHQHSPQRQAISLPLQPRCPTHGQAARWSPHWSSQARPSQTFMGKGGSEGGPDNVLRSWQQPHDLEVWGRRKNLEEGTMLLGKNLNIYSTDFVRTWGSSKDAQPAFIRRQAPTQGHGQHRGAECCGNSTHESSRR